MRVSICPRALTGHLRNDASNFHQIFMRVNYVRSLVFLWRACDVLRTSGARFTKYLTTILRLKKVKFSHTRYRASGPELIPVYRQSARRLREVNRAIDLAAVGCHYFLPGLRLPP